MPQPPAKGQRPAPPVAPAPVTAPLAGLPAASSALVQALTLAKHTLQGFAAAAVLAAWRALSHYNRVQVDQFLAEVLPVVAAANRQSVMLTNAFLAQSLGEQPSPIDVQQILAGLRNGTVPEDVYTRAFVAVWTALKAGDGWDKSVKIGLDRATSAAQTDVQLAFTHTLAAVGQSNDGIVGYQRVPDATACAFCVAAAGQRYTRGDLMPLHDRCGCSVAPITRANRHLFTGDPANDLKPAPSEFPGADGLLVGVREHGELGPLLVNAADHFTSEAELVHAH